mmetsp:Transcript_11563/g.25688  ORF Transcript_11563/g.25688 Transcript_11563/m.25688 type:complete len:286 (+) Transcript_11563:51-908(+)|eukprot:CAMPEP_0204265950 /NCGR_PEP_ID=MMETSP0468-20130131/10011_1 /ASSEMBLY_ACC=CAM_ASM_000383 /TAXON_ID=2969 /ORGANISM="Oxyrrhis marina" /LENGTH=285 /DNA_ID=CAMNT_0051240959 /DNA_START=50 /DNA_END=907 /DNA_ORIENTATION=-
MKLFATGCALAAAKLDIPTKEIRPGVHMPVVSIGTWVQGSKETENSTAIVGAWMDLGGRGVDTAWDYFDQPAVAKAIADHGVDRKDVFITTKIPACVGKGEAAKLVDADLKQLNTDYLDLVLVHMPLGFDCDGTWAALEEALKANKTRSIGVSNFRKSNLQSLLKKATVIPAVNQIGYSVFGHNEDTIQFCRQNNITVEAYSPLGSPGRGGKSVFTDPTVTGIATRMNVTAAQVALRWIVQRGDVLTVLSSNKDHQSNDADLFAFKLEDDDVAALDKIQEQVVVV